MRIVPLLICTLLGFIILGITNNSTILSAAYTTGLQTVGVFFIALGVNIGLDDD